MALPSVRSTADALPRHVVNTALLCRDVDVLAPLGKHRPGGTATTLAGDAPTPQHMHCHIASHPVLLHLGPEAEQSQSSHSQSSQIALYAKRRFSKFAVYPQFCPPSPAPLQHTGK